MDNSLVLRAFDWRYHNCGYQYKHQGDIHCWALNKDNKPCLLRILNFPISLYFELPFVVHKGKILKWTDEYIQAIVDTMTNICTYHKKPHEAPLSCDLVYKRLFYYYGGPKPMLHFTFSNNTAMYNSCKMLEQGILLKKYELTVVGRCIGNDIPPVLAFTVHQNIKHANWLQVSNYTIVSNKIAKDNILEYATDYYNVFPVADDICKDWQVFPTLLSWDIETYSPNHKHFPNASFIACKTTVISALFHIYDENTNNYQVEKHVLLLGRVNPQVVGDNVILHTFSPTIKEGELALLYEFCNLIETKNPDILMGYNTDNFDYPYITKRFSQWLNHTWPNISRLKEYQCKLVENPWKSAAYGINDSSPLDMEGRISIDVMTVIKREHKLPKYSLNYVSGHFLGDKKDDMTAAQMFAAFEDICVPDNTIPTEQALTQWGLVVKYAIQDTALVVSLYNYLEIWNYLSESADITHINITDTFSRGQQIRSFSLIYDYCTKYGYVVDTRQKDNDTYTGGYVKAPVVGVHDRVIVLDFESLYPNVMRSNNFCPTTLINPNHYDDVDTADVNIIEFTQEEDINSAANREIKKYNDDLLTTDKRDELPEHIVIKSYHYRFYNKEMGIVPRIENELLNWRQSVKNQMKTAKGAYKQILNARQLAIKVVCNSLYGFFGTGTMGMRPCPEIARCTTAKAREYIQSSFTFIEQRYNGTILAADTDSAMFTIPTVTRRDQCFYMGNLIAQEISGAKKGDPLPDGSGVHEQDIIGIFPQYIKFVHEKDMLVCFLCKKKYFAWYIKPDGSFKKDKEGNNELLAKGIILAQRNNALILTTIYRKLVELILSQASIYTALQVLIEHIDSIYQHKFDYTVFSTIATLGSNYTSKNYPLALFQNFLTSCGKNVKPGEKLDYLIIVNPYAKHVGYCMVLVEQYLESLGTTQEYKIDYDYYINKKIAKPINQLFACGFQSELTQLQPYIRFKLGRWVNERGLDSIVEIILKARELNLDYHTILPQVAYYLQQT